MSGPDVVRIKRKRSERAPEALLVERPGKRQHTIDTQYVLQKSQTKTSQSPFDAGDFERQVASRDGQGARGRAAPVSGNGREASGRERRTFHLKRPSTPEAGIKKRKHKGEGIATFVEKRVKRNVEESLSHAQRERSTSSTSAAAEPAFKRAGRGVSIKTSTDAQNKAGPSNAFGHAKTDSRMEAMASSLHQFAMEEAEMEAPVKPKITSPPKLPPHRSRELHRERTRRLEPSTVDDKAKDEMEVDEEADYVYDTYVLAPSSGVGATQIDAQDGEGSVGYLVITEEDQEVWETYIEDEPSDKDWNTDEDDENAEDWYGADYPDDELASDDEFGRNPYAFRGDCASDDEDWEESEHWGDKEFDRQTQPWARKTPQQFSKYFSGVRE